ncbi:hypothetical protein [Noviherbaspirillum malthae]|uniref:hypothetical protein n=1 Tax=Noviherbaspirillum malthae TaxID=1260987 RepID=UPI0018907908|nr:hypothetical protein [Noviherbaspirillum malthae]
MELSAYCFADEIRMHYAGMVTTVTPAAWERYDSMAATELAEMLLKRALHANPGALPKHPCGPTASAKTGDVAR